MHMRSRWRERGVRDESSEGRDAKACEHLASPEAKARRRVWWAHADEQGGTQDEH